MKFKFNNKEVFASTGGQPFDRNKPVILFIHGSGLNHITWIMQVRYFAFHGYSVLALDLPGHGYSDGPPLTTIEEMTDWILDIMNFLEIHKVSLVGHSQGCLVNLELASRKIIEIVSISFIGGASAIKVNPYLLNLAAKGDKKSFDLMMDWAHGPAGQFSFHSVPGLNHFNIGIAILKQSTPKVLGIDLMACHRYKNGLKAASILSSPVLSIIGSKDKMCPMNEGLKLANKINKSEIQIIENSGHMMLLEEPDKVLKILKNFIDSSRI